MSKFRRANVAFTAGELDPKLKGRRDAAIFHLGCEHLTNSLVRPQGSTFTRPGLRNAAFLYTGEAPAARLLPFVFSTDQRYVVWIGHEAARVYNAADGSAVSVMATPYTAAQVGAIDWIQIGDTLLLAHGAVPLSQIQRQVDGTFTFGAYAFEEPPRTRYQDRAIRLQASDTIGTVTMTCLDGPAFRPGYNVLGDDAVKVDIGGRWTFQSIGFTIVSVADDGMTAVVTVQGEFPSVGPSEVWTEQAAQEWCGYHNSVAYFQDRLWVGGSVQAPVTLWASRSGAPYDFLAGGVNDDDAFRLNLSDGRLEPIRYLQPAANGLEIYTSGSTGLIPGSSVQPITPGTVSYVPQTAFGAAAVKPVRMQSHTIMVQEHSGILREMIYDDTEQSYRADPLAIRAAHLVTDVVRLVAAPAAFGEQIDFLFALNGNGDGAALTFEKSQEVAAWSKLSATRDILDICSAGDRVYAAVTDGETVWLEYFDAAALFDSQGSSTLEEPSTQHLGFFQLGGVEADVIADGYWIGKVTVGEEGEIDLAEAATTVVAGLMFDWLIQPMPPESEQQNLLGRMVRPFRAEVRFDTSAALRVNGQPIYDRPFDDVPDTPPTSYSGVRRVHLTGYSNGEGSPIQITRDGPFKAEILSFAIDYRLGGV